MGILKNAAFTFAKHKITEAIEEEQSKRAHMEEMLRKKEEQERLEAAERRRRAEIEVAKRQKMIEENRRRESGHITYNDYIVSSTPSSRSYGHSGNVNSVRYKDSYAKRRSDDLNVPISQLKNNFKK